MEKLQDEVIKKMLEELDEMLKKVYGDYMKIPPENERVNHMPLIIQFEGEEPIYAEK